MSAFVQLHISLVTSLLLHLSCYISLVTSILLYLSCYISLVTSLLLHLSCCSHVALKQQSLLDVL